MVKISPLADVNIIATSGPTHNANNDKIEEAFNNTLSRDGSTPNQMEADIDLNGNDLLNVGAITVDSLTIQGQSVSQLIQASEDAVDAAAEALASKLDAASSASSAAADAATVASQLAFLPDWRSSWVTATAYEIGDVVKENGDTYICLTPHTSGTWSVDFPAGKWDLFLPKGTAGTGTGDMFSANNLNDVANKPTARANLGVPSSSVDSAISANWVFADNPTGSLRFGTDSDVKIWWDNTNSIFAFQTHNTPTAVLKFRFPFTEVMNFDGSKTSAKFTPDTAAELFYNGSKKFETTNTGVTITGSLTLDTILGSVLASNSEAIAGTLNDVVITPSSLKATLDNTITANFGSTGYISFKLNSTVPRFYLQWGRFSLAYPAASGQRITYATAMPTITLGTWLGVDNAAAQQIGTLGLDRFGYTVQKGSGDVGIRTGYWYAIGY